MLEIITSNFVTMSLVVGLALQLAIGNVFDKKMERNFLIALILTTVLVFCDFIEAQLVGLSFVLNLRYITAILAYIIRPTTLVLIISLLLSTRKNKYKEVLLWTPIIIEVILMVSTPFTHLVFYYDQNNIFHRGPLGYFAHILGLMYLLVFVYVVIRMSKEVNQLEILTVAFICVICISATVLESFYGARYLMPGAITASLTIYYLYIYVQLNNVDILTNLLNRRSFFIDVNKISNVPMAVIVIDLNDLKKINDTQGHTAGDVAISEVAKIIKGISGKAYKAYRVGGDEFMILGLKQEESNVKLFIDKIKKEVEKTEYRLSIGYAMSTSSATFEDACILADNAMYEDKKRYKENKLV